MYHLHFLNPEEEEMYELNLLKYLYSSKSVGKPIDSEELYFTYYNIASVLRKENKLKEALVYYLYAFITASNGTYQGELDDCTYYISFIYSLLGNKNLAKRYLDLNLYLANKLGNGSYTSYSTLDHVKIICMIQKI